MQAKLSHHSTTIYLALLLSLIFLCPSLVFGQSSFSSSDHPVIAKIIKQHKTPKKKMSFIAVADRRIEMPILSNFYHYSLQKWECPCEVIDQVKLHKVYEQPIKGCKKVASVELLRNARKKIFTGKKTIWGKPRAKKIPMSIVHFSDKNRRFQPLLISDTSQLTNIVDEKWEVVIEHTVNYEYAELELDFKAASKVSDFKNFPHSRYPKNLGTGTNSNTFAKEIIERSGIEWKPLPGLHPGDERAGNGLFCWKL